MATTVTLKTPDGDMGLYDAEPEGEARAAVIVAQEAFGVNPHIEDVTRRLAGAGYRAVAPHLFHRTGDPVIEYGDYEKIMPQFAGLSEAGVVNDLDASIAYLEEAGFTPSRIGVVGFCMGGTVAYVASVRRPLGAGVTFYGGGVTEGRFGMASMVDLAPGAPDPVAGLVRGRGPGHPGGAGRGPPGRGGRRQGGRRDRPVSRGRSRVPLRHAERLSPRGGRGRLEADPRLVREVPGDDLTSKRVDGHERATAAETMRVGPAGALTPL